MKFMSFIKRRDDALSALKDAEWRHQRSLDHLSKVKSERVSAADMTRLSSLTESATNAAEKVRRLEIARNNALQDAETAAARLRSLEPILNDLNARLSSDPIAGGQ